MSEQTGPPSPDEVLAAAERYAAAGLKIYPVRIVGLKPDGKKDVRVPVKSWAASATDDLDQVHAWWGPGGQYPDAGIGVDMGASHLAVADADVKDGVDGIRRLMGEIEYPEVGGGESWESRTPSGGLHVWYSDPDGQCGSGSNVFGTKDEPSGVDVRGVGGTIFMAPTYVPGYGRYEWSGGEPEWTRLPRVPERLAAACPPGGRKKEPAALAAPRLGAVPDDPFATPGSVGLAAGMAADRMMSKAEAKRRLQPLWEEIRDTKSPNGVWQAVANFAQHAAHYQCFWDAETIGAMVLAAYAEGGHGYTELDHDDVRAINSAYGRHAAARLAGNLDDGWAAIAQPDLAEAVEAVPDDAVEALLAEMLTPAQIKERPGKRYLIKGLLNLDSESWIIGAPGCRKSFVALDMAARVATGTPWQGRPVNGGTVVIIAAEGAGGLGARIKAWEQEHGQQMPENIHVLPRPVQVANTAAWAVLVKACERLGAVFVIIDTQARVTAGLKENAAEDMSIFITAVTAVRRATASCVLAVHHTGRAGGDARGSSAIDGAQDTELKVVALPEKLRGELRIEKQKDLAEGAAVPLMFKIHMTGIDQDGEPVTSLALCAPDAWAASEVGPDVPEEWETGHAVAIVQLFKVLRDQGGTAGLTKAEARTAMVERFYGGQQKTLAKSTFYTAWDRGLGKLAVSGDPAMVNLGGQRWGVDEGALKELASPAGTAE